MLEYQLNIIREYISTTLNSKNPEEALEKCIIKIINESAFKPDATLDYLYKAIKENTDGTVK